MLLGRSMATAGATCTVMHGRSLCHRLVGCGYGIDLEAKLEAVRTGGVGQVDGADRQHEIHLQQAGEGGGEGGREGGREGGEGREGREGGMEGGREGGRTSSYIHYLILSLPHPSRLHPPSLTPSPSPIKLLPDL